MSLLTTLKPVSFFPAYTLNHYVLFFRAQVLPRPFDSSNMLVFVPFIFLPYLISLLWNSRTELLSSIFVGLQGDLTSPSERRSVLNIHWCWSWSSNTLTTWCEEPSHWKRPWCWKRLKAGEGGDRGWDGWVASLTQRTWVWASSGVGDGQGGLVCCGSWGCKELDMTEQLNWKHKNLLTDSTVSQATQGGNSLNASKIEELNVT